MSAFPAAMTHAERQRQNTARLVAVITLLLVFIMAARTPLDSDLFWHLRAGEETLRTGRPVLVDTFSYTRAGAPWINHSWLAQVILALLYRTGGPLALGLLVAGLATSSLALAYVQMRGPALLRAFLVILTGVVAAPVWTPRPQLFSLLLFAITAGLLDRYAHRPDRRILWLLPLFVLWSNLHGGYPLGLMLIAASIAGLTFDRLFAVAGRAHLPWGDIGRLVWVGLAAFALTALNPNGLQMWLIPFKTVNVGLLQTLIQEWASPDFHDPVQQPFLVLFLFCAAAMAASKKPAGGVDVAWLVVFGGLGLVARRNFGPFALVAGPLLARVLANGMGAVSLPEIKQNSIGLRIANVVKRLRGEPGEETQRTRLVKMIINLLLTAVLGLVAAGKVYTVTQPVFYQSQVEIFYPVRAVEWLRANPPAGRLFNAYNWGGYLLWTLPETPVFVDGRTDLYGDEILSQWITVVQAGQGWQAILDRWQVSAVLLEPDRPVVALLAAAGWQPVIREAGYVLYVR